MNNFGPFAGFTDLFLIIHKKGNDANKFIELYNLGQVQHRKFMLQHHPASQHIHSIIFECSTFQIKDVMVSD